MFSLLFGFVLLALTLVFRDWAEQDEQAGDLESAGVHAVTAVGCMILAVIFVVIGLVGA